MKKIIHLVFITVCSFGISIQSYAKLPDATPEAKEAAAVAAAKTAHGNKKADFALCLAQNKVAKSFATKDKVMPTAECADPGEFKMPVAAVTPVSAPATPPAKPAEVASAGAKPAEPAKK